MSSIIPYVKRPARSAGRVVELAGTYLEKGFPYGVSWPLAHRLQLPLERIPMPVIVRSKRVKDLMMEEPSIRQAFADAEHVDLALVGLGQITPESTLVRSGYLGATHLRELKAKGVVGEVLMSCYDARGRPVRVSFQDRVVSIGLERIARLPRVVALAFGPEKLEAIRGALRGGFIHGLVTDRETAAALLGKEGERSAEAKAQEKDGGEQGRRSAT